MSANIFAVRFINDSINVAGISGTDTVVVIQKRFLNFGNTFAAEFEYTDLSHDDAILDIGTRLEILGGATGEIADSTFNSYGSILGVSLPYTLNATSNADSYYNKASVLITHQKRMFGTELLIKITKGSVTSGYIRYRVAY